MVRYLTWVANSALFVLCCFLVANTANAVIAAWLAPPAAAALTPRAEVGAMARGWNDRQIIIARNLFHSAELTAKVEQPEPEPDEEIEETRLPLKLWGTIASDNPKLAWASVQDENDRQGDPIVLAVGDDIKGAKVLTIERKRIVLLEKGARRALSIDDGPEAVGTLARAAGIRPTPRSKARRSRSARSRNRPSRRAASRAEKEAAEQMAERVKKVAENTFEVEEEDVQEAMNNPADLYSQARILPHVDDDGQVSGIEISAIKPGSVFEQVGMQDGEVITEIGGVPINDVTQSGEAFSKLMQAGSWDFTIMGTDGTVREATIQTAGSEQDE